MDAIFDNKILMRLLLVLTLFAPIFLIKKLRELINNKDRSFKDYAVVCLVFFGLLIVYCLIFDFNMRIALGIPSFILLMISIIVTFINKRLK